MNVQQVLLLLNTRHPVAAEDMRDVQRMHVRTCRMVGTSRADARLLWRLLWRIDGRILLVQAARRIDLSELPDGYARLIEQRDVPLDWQRGAVVRWELVANPTKCEPRTKRRIGLSDPDACADWIESRLPKAGLRPTRIDVWQLPLGRGCHPRGDLVVGRWLFRGIAVVDDPEALAKALVNGIGKAKAYGAGLLTVEELQP